MGEYDATPRPDVAPPTRWEFPLPTTTMLDNGLTVHTYHLPGMARPSSRASSCRCRSPRSLGTRRVSRR